MSELSEKEISQLRRDKLGFVFQDFNLLDTFTLEDNIYLPLVLAGEKHAEMKRRLIPLAVQLGIEPLLKNIRMRCRAVRSRGRRWRGR